MHSSLLNRPPGGRFLQVRPEWVEVTGSSSAAVVIGVLDGRMRMQQHDSAGWLRRTYRELTDDACGIIGRRAIDTAVERLIDLGFLERRQLDDDSDRAFYWRLNVDAINQAFASTNEMDVQPHASAHAGGRAVDAQPNVARASQGVNPKDKEENTNARDDARAQEQDVWDLYKRLVGKNRSFEPKHRRLIRRAIDATTLEEVKRAVVGLSRSPFHNGDNENNRKYLDLHYALKPSERSGQTVAERVSYMAQFAETADTATAVPVTRDRGVLEGRVSDCKRRVLRAANLAKRRALFDHEEADRDEAIVELSAMGIQVVVREDGWPTFEDGEQAA